MRYEAEGGDPAKCVLVLLPLSLRPAHELTCAPLPRSAGLEHARRFLEPIKEKHPWITYADLWTLAGVVAVKEMGGPDCKWKPGRTDFVDESKVRPSSSPCRSSSKERA